MNTWNLSICLALAAFIAAITLSGSALSASPLIGIASVIDGDTIEIRGIRIRLHGIVDSSAGRRLLNAAAWALEPGYRVDSG